MKKHLEKIIAITLAAVSLVFIITLLIVSFSEEAAAGVTNIVVQVLVLVFAAILVGGSAVNIYMSFVDKARVNRLLVSKSGKANAEVSIKCVRKIAKQAASAVRGANLKKIIVYESDKGEVTFRASLMIKAPKDDPEPLEKASVILEKVTAALELEFMDVFSLEFGSIKLKLVSADSYKAPTEQQINDRIAGAPLVAAVPAVDAGSAEQNIKTAQAQESAKKPVKKEVPIRCEEVKEEYVEPVAVAGYEPPPPVSFINDEPHGMPSIIPMRQEESQDMQEDSIENTIDSDLEDKVSC